MLALCCDVLSCGQTADPIQDAADRVEKLIVPPEVKGLVSEGIERQGSSVRKTWEFDVNMSWEAYSAWVEPRVRSGGFEKRNEGKEPALDFLHTVPGGGYDLTLEPLRVGPPLHVKARYLAWAS